MEPPVIDTRYERCLQTNIGASYERKPVLGKGLGYVLDKGAGLDLSLGALWLTGTYTNDISLQQQAPSPSELAISEFLKRLHDIHNVGIHTYGTDIKTLRILVRVPDMWSDVADAVISLKSEIHRKYPSAVLQVDITDVENSEYVGNEYAYIR
jgi:hypothetical protein